MYNYENFHSRDLLILPALAAMLISGWYVFSEMRYLTSGESATATVNQVHFTKETTPIFRRHRRPSFLSFFRGPSVNVDIQYTDRSTGQIVTDQIPLRGRTDASIHELILIQYIAGNHNSARFGSDSEMVLLFVISLGVMIYAIREAPKGQLKQVKRRRASVAPKEW